MKTCTVAQFNLIQALRKEAGLLPLNSHNAKCLSIDSASIMIADLKGFLDTVASLGGEQRA